MTSPDAQPTPRTNEEGHCGFRFKSGSRCFADTGHPIHNGGWEKIHGLEPNHDFDPVPHRYGLVICADCGSHGVEREAADAAALDPDRLRQEFIRRGWSIHMADNEHAVSDPFAELARLRSEGTSDR